MEHQIGRHEEAMKLFHFAQPGYEKPQGNLQEIRRRMKARG